MGVVLLAFRRMQRKQRELFRTLGAPVALSRHGFLVWLYVLMIAGIGLVSAYLKEGFWKAKSPLCLMIG